MKDQVGTYLRTEVIGKILEYYGEVGSSNDVAYEMAAEGSPEGTVVVADSQTKGRGRLHRKWISPPGMNLYISIILRPEIPTHNAPLLTLITSIALSETVRGFGADPRIKWPNDLLINGRKFAGILNEMQPKGEVVDFIVIGVGVNLNMSRRIIQEVMGEIGETATSILEVTGKTVDRAQFAAGFLMALENWYFIFKKEGSSYILNEWKNRWGELNKRIRVRLNGKVMEGTAFDVDDAGHLLLRKDDGSVERIIAGDVILP